MNLTEALEIVEELAPIDSEEYYNYTSDFQTREELDALKVVIKAARLLEMATQAFLKTREIGQIDD